MTASRIKNTYRPRREYFSTSMASTCLHNAHVVLPTSFGEKPRGDRHPISP